MRYRVPEDLREYMLRQFSITHEPEIFQAEEGEFLLLLEGLNESMNGGASALRTYLLEWIGPVSPALLSTWVKQDKGLQGKAIL